MTPPRTGRTETWDATLPGFGLRVSATGAKAFVLVTRLRGVPIRLSWKYPATSLADARDHARAAIQAIARGEDPRERKRPAPPPPDAFETVAAEFVERWSKPRKRTWEEDERIFAKYVTPTWTGRPVESITRTDVVALLEHVATTHGPIMSNRVLATVRKLFGWALNRGRLSAHPAAGLERLYPERSRDRVLTDAELTKLWRAWEGMGYPWGPAFKVLVLTAVRRSEAERMTWSEIDVGAKLWTIPSERTKTAVAHLVPLSRLALEILKDVPRFAGTDYVFASARRGPGPVRDWSGAVERAIEASGVEGWRVHDLRRTVRTGLARLNVASDIGERVLGHAVGGVRAVYDKHQYEPQMRDALETWSGHVAKVVKADGEA